MSRIAFIQQNAEGFPGNVNFFTAWEGFQERGFDVRLFAPTDVPTMPIDRSTIVHGGFPCVWAVFDRLGIARPPYINYPQSLTPFLHRRVWETDLGEIRNNEDLWPVFIKPLETAKIFTGHVVEDIRWLRITSHLSNEVRVFAQTPIVFRSEWRVYICQGTVLGIGNYKGNTLLFPNRARIEEMVAAYTEAPAGFGLDVGVTDTGETALVEVNDGYALGNYSLPPPKYSRLIETRWDEICRERNDEEKR